MISCYTEVKTHNQFNSKFSAYQLQFFVQSKKMHYSQHVGITFQWAFERRIHFSRRCQRSHRALFAAKQGAFFKSVIENQQAFISFLINPPVYSDWLISFARTHSLCQISFISLEHWTVNIKICTYTKCDAKHERKCQYFCSLTSDGSWAYWWVHKMFRLMVWICGTIWCMTMDKRRVQQNIDNKNW